MSFVDTPARRPAMARLNSYDRNCHHCNFLVPAQTGTAFLLWNDAAGKNTWHSAHGDEWDANDCFGKVLANAPKPDHPTGPVAAKVVQGEALVAKLAEPEPTFTMPEGDVLEALLATMVSDMSASLVTDMAAEFNKTVPTMVAALLASARPVAITIGDAPTVVLDTVHKDFNDVLLMVVADTSPMLTGPAGSGKTTLAKQVAKAMALPFWMTGRVSGEHKLMGYFHPHNGELIRTPFREAWEHGGIFLLDEVDASDPEALTAINAALAGDLADFPDGLVPRHKDFKCIAAGNTVGRGADRVYVGRNQLDGATLDRFEVVDITYDEELEFRIAGNDDWVKRVQKVRAAVDAEKIRHIVSPRASISGAKLLAAGMDWNKVEQACIWKGLDAGQQSRINARMGAY